MSVATVPLFERARAVSRRQSDWAGCSADCQNLSEAFAYLGRLGDALAAAEDALTETGKLPDEHHLKRNCAIFGHGYAGWAAALRGDDETASRHFTAALDLDPEDWLASIPGGCHCISLARTGKLERARSGGRKNAEFCADRGDLPSQTFMGATQALIERLAWAAGDPNRATLDEMRSFADRGIEVSRRSGYHYYLTYALLEAARCAIASAVHEPQRRAEFMQQAKRRLDEVERRAAFGEYRLIEADAHVAQAELARLAGDEQTMRKKCEAAIAICDDPTCGYAWAKQDAEKLLSG